MKILDLPINTYLNGSERRASDSNGEVPASMLTVVTVCWRIITARIRRMGKVMFSVCPHLGGYPYPIMLCNISQNAMGQTPRGEGGTLPGPAGGWYPARSSWGGDTLPGSAGGYPAGGDTLLGGYPARGYRPGQVRTGERGYPVRTTEGVLTTRRAVCLLGSRRRTFLFFFVFTQ